MDAIFLVFAVIIGVQLFFGMKRQKKVAQEAKEMMDSMVPGSAVVTIGGLHGIVSEVNESTVVIDCEGIYLTFERRAIARVVPAATTTTSQVSVEELYPQEDVQEESKDTLDVE